MPGLIKAYDALPASDPLKAKLAEQIAMLRTWDLRWSATSIPTSLAFFWAQAVQRGGGGRRGGASGEDYWSQRRGGARAGAVAGDGQRQDRRRLRHVEDAVGRHQPLSAPDRRHRASRSATPARAFR